MATYQQWLQTQETEEGPAGDIARWWASEEAGRPRVSSPSGIEKWMLKMMREGSLVTLSDDQKAAMRASFGKAVLLYHERGGNGPGGVHTGGMNPADSARLQRIEDRLDQIWGRIELIHRRQEHLLELAGVPTAAIPPESGPAGTPPGASAPLAPPVRSPAGQLAHDAALAVRAKLGDPAAMPQGIPEGAGWGQLYLLADHAAPDEAA